MPIATVAVRLDTVDELVKAGGDVNDFGVTSPPRSFTTPDFNINPVQSKNGWTVSVQLLGSADEGSNTSVYLGAGLHRTGLMFSDGAVTHYTEGDGNREIYRIVTEQIANLSRQAELEHCSDIRQAYAITLEAAETAIVNARQAVLRQRYGSRSDAMKGALAALTKGLAKPLAQVFRNAVNVNWSVDRLRFQRELGQLYLDTANMTQNRDNQGWHTFGFERDYESWSVTSWANYSRYAIRRIPLLRNVEESVYGEDKDIRDVITPPGFQVPGPASKVVVHL